ncbi:hypothetical protein [Sorangium sp. So ce388]|uniref:hypothetical protein n=1 Tax=Sorangium sp. So ce388 TaxID=3133309 RepID=UPI003F5CAB81
MAITEGESGAGGEDRRRVVNDEGGASSVAVALEIADHAGHDVALDELPLASSRLAQRGSGNAVDLAQARSSAGTSTPVRLANTSEHVARDGYPYVTFRQVSNGATWIVL